MRSSLTSLDGTMQCNDWQVRQGLERIVSSTQFYIVLGDNDT